MSLNRPDYSDLHRFYASVGLLLIGAALVAPYALLREMPDPVLTEVELSQLPTQTQLLITERLNRYAWLVNHVDQIVGALLLVGGGCLIRGLLPWGRNQKSRDKLDRARESEEMNRLSPDQIQQKGEREAEEGVVAGPGDGAQSFNAAEYLAVEEYALRAIEAGVPHDRYSFRSQIRIAGREFDCVLLSKADHLPNISIEIKYVRNLLLRPPAFWREIADRVRDSADRLPTDVTVSSVPIILAVVTSAERFPERLKSIHTHGPDLYSVRGVPIVVVQAEELEEMAGDAMWRRLQRALDIPKG